MPRRAIASLLSALLWTAVFAPGAKAQSAATTQAGETPSEATSEDIPEVWQEVPQANLAPIVPGIIPEAYRPPPPESFFGRFEIIAVGSFPLMLLYSNFGFDLVTFVGSGFDARYAPWPFRDEYSMEPAESERILRLGIATGASVLVAALDVVFRLIRDARRAEAAKPAAAKAAVNEGFDSAPAKGNGFPLPSAGPP